MYDELVKRLHRYSENCVAYKLDADFADAVQQAADAIEGLQEGNAALNGTVSNLIEQIAELSKPKEE